MWRLLLGAALLAGVVGCGSEGPAGSAALTNMAFHVEGMMCEESCAKSVEEILASRPGVQGVDVNFEEKIALCEVDPRTFDVDAAIVELADQDFVATPAR